MPRILVTGASGFLGRNFLASLQSMRPDASVRALVRNSGTVSLPEAGWEIVEGDVTVPRTLEGLFRDVDVVVHLASKIIAADPDDYQRVNVEGTGNVLRQSVYAGVRRIITISNAGVYGFERGNGQEEREPRSKPRTPVSASRLGAERLLLDAHRRHEIEAVILRPLFVYGDGDRFFIPAVLRSLRRFPFLIRTSSRFSVISARDLGNAITMLCHGGLPVAEYPVYHATDGIPRSLEELLRVLATSLPITIPERRLPYPLAVAGISLSGLRGSLFPQRVQTAGASQRTITLTELRHRLHLVSRDHYYSNARLASLLPELRFTDFEEGLAACLPYYQAQCVSAE